MTQEYEYLYGGPKAREVPVQNGKIKPQTGEGPRATHYKRLITELLCIIRTEFAAGRNTLR